MYLHTHSQSVPWPLSDLRQGRWPQNARRPFIGNNVKFAIGRTCNGRNQESVQLVFLTWNPEVSVEDAGDMAAQPTEQPLVDDAGSLHLRIIQFHGNRLDVLKGIVWKENYNVFEYRPEALRPLVSLTNSIRRGQYE